MPTEPDNARLADELERLLDRRADRIGVPGARVHDQLTRFVEHHRAAILSALRQQVRAVPGGALAHELREQSRYPSGQPRISLETAKSVVAAALSTQPPKPVWQETVNVLPSTQPLLPDEFIHRAPTSVDPSLEGPGVVPDDVKAMIERLRDRSDLPSAYDIVGDKIEDLFDPGLRHKSGMKPFDYLKQWLSMLRPFAYATHDDSWGEMEKLLCIVMRNYVEMKRLNAKAATMLETLHAEIGRAVAVERERIAGGLTDEALLRVIEGLGHGRVDAQGEAMDILSRLRTMPIAIAGSVG